VSFSLYGHAPIYLEGAVANAEAVPRMYPGWQARFYVSQEISRDLVAELRRLGAETIRMNRRGLSDGTFWRFLAADDDIADAAIFRDVDSRISAREVDAVEEWLASGRGFHLLRDHPGHRWPMMAGMWGVRPGALPPIRELYRRWRWRRRLGGDIGTSTPDQAFLRSVVYPIARHDALVHSEFTWFEGEGVRPFSTPPPEGEFIGQVVRAGGIPDPLAARSWANAPRPLGPEPLHSYHLVPRALRFARHRLSSARQR
jgi:hypothetical protein